jgi:transcription-repair coupling factor (superfamily II helicase)
MDLAFIATRIFILKTDDITYLTDDQQRVEALLAAVHALDPGGLVYHIASSNPLPDEVATASPVSDDIVSRR